jgi:Transmembrane exosortase (Exosortase_EpsH).
MHFMGMHNTLINDTYLFYQTPNGGFVNIIWGCTGVKQFLMFFIIMLVTPGSFKKKLWFTPLALFLLWAYNITRIIVITYKTGIDPSCFEYLHVIFNNVFYVFMFIIWLVWEELVNKKKIQGVTY